MGNDTPQKILKNGLLAAIGLACFGVGLYFTIQANIGVFPWDVFHIGLSEQLGIKYGNVTIMINLLLIAVDYGLHERIGIGTFIDAVVVGKTVDLCNWLGLIVPRESVSEGLVLMILGLTIMGFSQYLYMKAGLCCGPKDTLMVGLNKKAPKVPIMFISNCILLVVLAIGWVLGGPVGIGTVVSAIGSGVLMQMAFRIMKFDPLEVKHQSLVESVKVLTGKQSYSDGGTLL